MHYRSREVESRGIIDDRHLFWNIAHLIPAGVERVLIPENRRTMK